MSNNWDKFKAYTNARIGMGSISGSLDTTNLLKFNQDFALAKDAVWHESDYEQLSNKIDIFSYNFLVNSLIATKAEFLQNPPKGEILNEESIYNCQKYQGQYDVCIILSDGLSGRAIENYGFELASQIFQNLNNYSIAPIILAKYGRVAISDHIGSLIGAKIALIIIGERPGLSSHDSLGIYFTYDPKIGNTDEVRNCISNIHAKGLAPQLAAEKCAYLIGESLRRKLSGVNLKDDQNLTLLS